MQQLDCWIVRRAKQQPNQVALIQLETNETWSYDRLVRYSYGWCRYFKKSGLQKGARVAALMENTITSFAILFACRMQQLIFVPLNTRLAKQELAEIVRDCEPALLIFDEVNEERAKALGSLCVDVQTIAPAEEYEGNWCDEPRLPWLMLYTGGTTGKAKGVVLSDEAVTTNAVNTVISWGLTANDRTLNYMPLFHTGGINALALPILLAGGTVVVGKRFDPERAVRALNDYNTTISLFVPTMYARITETDYFWQADFPTVKVFLSGGAPCPKQIYERFSQRGLLFKEGYGLTEAGPNNFFIEAQRAMQKIGSVGKSMLLNEVRLINEHGAPCRVGEVGELYLKGGHVFSGYWRNEEETKQTLRDGWLNTGDLARFDEDGDYYIVGRKKEMIITGGENVYPLEVERVLLSNAFVSEAAVVGIEDELWGQCVVAFVCAEEIDEATLIAYCKANLANYKVPKHVLIIESLPKTAVGKIDKPALIQMAEQKARLKMP